MAYEKQTFTDWEYDASGNVVKEGTTLNAAHLRHIEDGIVALEKAQGTQVTGFTVTETDTDVTLVLTMEGGGTNTHVLGFDENGNLTSITVNGKVIPGTWTVEGATASE